MPRNEKFVAYQKLQDAFRNHERAKKAAKRAQESLWEAMVRAVEAGNTRAEVAKLVGVSTARVSQIPGMPAGVNVHKRDDDAPAA